MTEQIQKNTAVVWHSPINHNKTDTMVPLKSISSLILVFFLGLVPMTIPSIISKEKGQFIIGKGCGNAKNPIRFLEHVPENTKGYECSFIQKRNGFIAFEPEDSKYLSIYRACVIYCCSRVVAAPELLP